MSNTIRPPVHPPLTIVASAASATRPQSTATTARVLHGVPAPPHGAAQAAAAQASRLDAVLPLMPRRTGPATPPHRVLAEARGAARAAQQTASAVVPNSTPEDDVA